MKKILYLFLLLFPLMLAAQSSYNGNVNLVDNFMTAQASVKRFNGNVLIAKSGDVIYQKSFGYRNYDTKELLNGNSIFEIASLSKQFTAVGITYKVPIALLCLMLLIRVLISLIR